MPTVSLCMFNAPVSFLFLQLLLNVLDIVNVSPLSLQSTPPLIFFFPKPAPQLQSTVLLDSLCAQ